MNKPRASVIAALVVTGFAVLYAAGSAVTGWEPSAGWLIQAIIHLGELLIVAALAGSGAAGRGRAARVGLGAAAAGQVILAVAEVLWPGLPDLGDVLFAAGPLLTGAGLVTAGVVTLRARVWAGPARFLPLALGLYTILVLTPVMIGSGGPPAPAALWTIAGWDLLWCTLGAAVLGRTRTAAPSDQATVRVTVR